MSVKLGRNEKCWCGSGRKFKRCHLDREAQSPLTRQEFIKRIYRPPYNRHCLHPDAGPETCSDRLIKGHTIQRNGALSRIARKGHVFSILRHGKLFDEGKFDLTSEPHKVGIRDASTFTGFCSRHDDELFAPIEKYPFTGTVTQIALLGYRALCYELFMKNWFLQALDLRRDQDKGQSPHFQQLNQEAIYHLDMGADSSIRELEELKALYEEVIFGSSPSHLDYYVVFLDKSPEVQCCGITIATHDFRGRRIYQIRRHAAPASWLAFSLIPAETSGAAVFSWPARHSKSEVIMKTLDELTDSALPHAIIRFAFEFFENTYFSPEWWEDLDERVQFLLKERQLRDVIGPWAEQEFPRPDWCLLDDGIRAVQWSAVSRVTSLNNGEQRPQYSG